MASKRVSTSKTGDIKKPLIRHNSSFDMAVQGAAVKNKNLKIMRTEKKVEKTAPSRTKGKKENKVNRHLLDFDQAAEDQFDVMIKGKLGDIPNVPRSVVRVFLSSTFSDMRTERNALVQIVNPKLKEFCSAYDLDFQMVDMRWGVTDDSQNDHTVEKICLLEIENCQKISLGTNFVAIAGNRYGFRPIPTEMAVNDFNLLLNYTTDSKDVRLLNTWYIRDDNAQPPQYVLQPIRSQFTFFGDHSPGCDEPREKDTKNWHKTFSDLQNIMRTAAGKACQDGKLTKEQLHQYFLSVTELEINKGILQAASPKLHTLAYHRDMTGLQDDALKQTNASRYIDVKEEKGDVTLDKDTQKLREELLKKIKATISEKHCKQYALHWHDGGVDPSRHKQHDKYIEMFCIDFISDVIDQINLAMQNYLPKIRFSGYYTYYHELIHHLQFCKTKCETFCGQTDILDVAKHYILHDTSRKPLVFHAVSGAGKTSVMAMIMNKLSSWLSKKDHVGIIRFLGTSPFSINIYDVLVSVCGQLADNADIIMEPVSYKNMKTLEELMPRFFRRVANQLKIPIIIILDSLDQLSSMNDAYSLNWLPTTLPPNIKLILSTLPKEHGILDNLKALLPEPNCYVEVQSLSTLTGREITTTYLKKKHRTVTEKQMQFLLNTFEKSPNPLFLKLLLDQAVTWNSYTPEHELVLADSVIQAISQLFTTLETKYGQVITSRTLGYITIGLNGISETEIEDVLSCDDEALNDVYRYHDPPVEGVIRIPPVLWARISYDLKEYLVERRSYNKYTLNWYHRQFIETARSKYSTGRDGEKLHKTMTEVFMAENGIKRSIELKWRKKTIENCDRQVTLQPLTSKNIRRLACLPFHIIHAGSMMSTDTAKAQCFCNFNFIRAKINGFSRKVLLEDMNQYIEKTEDQEVQKLRNFFSVVKTDVTNDIRLSVNLLARVSPDEDHLHIKGLLNDARKFLMSQRNTILIPRYPCLAPRRDTSSTLLDTLKDCQNIICESSETVLLEMAGNQPEENADIYALYNAVTEELNYVNIPKIANASLEPKLDRSGKKIIYVEKGFIKILNTLNMKTSTTSIADVTSEPAKGKAKPVITATSWDASELAILFEDCDLLMVDLNSMKKVDMTTLKEDAGDVTQIICGSVEKQVVVIIGSIGKASGDKTTKGFLRVWFAKKSGESPFRELQTAFSNGHVGIGASEKLIVGVSNNEAQTRVLCMDIDSLDNVSELTVSHPVRQLIVSKSRSEAAVLTTEGIVSILDCKKGNVIQELPINNSVTYFNISWQNDLAFLGDNEGQIIMYNVRKGIHRGAFPAHQKPVSLLYNLDDHIVSLSRNKEMKIWSLTELENDIKENTQNKNEEDMSNLINITSATCFDISLDCQELIVACQNQKIQVWCLKELLFSRKYDMNMVINKMRVVHGDMCIALESATGKLKIFDIKSGNKAMSDEPKNVIDFAVSVDMSNFCTVCDKDKGLFVELFDLTVKKSKKSFYLKQPLIYESLETSFNANGRYLLLRTKQKPEQLKEIELSWKKQGSFLPQYHSYRYTAVDLTQATGGLMPCLRMMSKIPHLGEVIHPFQGNIVMVTTRRWVLFWDIPTGKCDQKVSRVEKKGMMYRPDYLGQECRGTSLALVQTNDGQFVGVGSEDGYMFVYRTDTGLPVGKQAPVSKHSAPVTIVVASPDSRWIVSACRNNTIKVWETGSGKETFSTRVNAEVTCIKFSQDSQTVVVTTGTHVTRILVYTLLAGE